MIKIGDFARLSQVTEVYDYIRKQDAKDDGLCMTLWHSLADVYTNEDAEVIVVIDRALPGTDRVKVYKLPPTQVAAVVHHGDFEEFTQGHAALLEWIDSNGYRIVGPYREIYIKHEKKNLADTITEIQFPVEKAYNKKKTCFIRSTSSYF